MEFLPEKTLVLFDVDGTLTAPRQVIKDDFKNYLLMTLQKKCNVGIVGGSDLTKITEQLGGMEVLKQLDYVFSENGLVAMKDGVIFSKQSMVEFIGEDKMQELINGCLEYMSKLVLPVKRGTFIEFRAGMLNVSPIGRNCSVEERNAFEQYDKENQIRAKFITYLTKRFPELPLNYVIGGQISFDVFPKGWDKTFCLQFLEHFDKIYFFGDKCYEGGNDFEIFNDPRTAAFNVKGPEDTRQYLDQLLKSGKIL